MRKKIGDIEAGAVVYPAVRIADRDDGRSLLCE